MAALMGFLAAMLASFVAVMIAAGALRRGG
jgi:hypothetical protein